VTRDEPTAAACCRIDRILTRLSSAANVDPRGSGSQTTLGGSRCHEFS
jgi:hypothetical protein